MKYTSEKRVKLKEIKFEFQIYYVCRNFMNYLNKKQNKRKYCARELGSTLVNSVGIEKKLWYQQKYWNQTRKNIKATAAREPRERSRERAENICANISVRGDCSRVRHVEREMMNFWTGRTTNTRKDARVDGSRKANCHWLVELKKGWIFEWTSPCKGWSARGHSSVVDVACVLRKGKRKRDKGCKELEKGGKGRSRKRSRKRKRNKKHACARSAFSAQVHSSYENRASSLFPTSFSRKAC